MISDTVKSISLLQCASVFFTSRHITFGTVSVVIGSERLAFV
jgi:hypothetical protein